MVAYITGNGFKTQECVQERVSKPHLIQARLNDFRTLYDKLVQSKQVSQSAPVAAHR